jgi:hypothetical protein
MAGIIIVGLFTTGVALGAAFDTAVRLTVRPTYGWRAATGVSAGARVLSAAGMWRANRLAAPLGPGLGMMPELGMLSGFTVSPAVVALARVSAIATRILLLQAQRANAATVRFLWQCTRRLARRDLD